VSLKQIVKKIKGFHQKYVKSLIWVWIIILSFINSYILGFLSGVNDISGELLKIEYDPNIEITIDDLNKKNNSNGNIYASKNGSKYYFSYCSSRIKEENKIFFENEDQAREEGYDLSATCN
jgi:hypothetical protein